MLIALWPHHWSRQQRSNATLVSALVLMVFALALLGQGSLLPARAHRTERTGLSAGARTTLWLTLVSGSVGLALGTAAALARTARWAALRWAASFYIWAIRGTPLLVQILFVYFALPVLVPGLNLPDFAAAVVALALNVGAYNAEAIRAGLLAVPGARPKPHALWAWAAPMYSLMWCSPGLQDCTAALVSNFVALLKDSSLAYAIGVVELTNVGNRIQSATFQPIATLTTVAVTYLLLTTLVTQISNAIEYRFDVEGRNQ